MRDEREITVPIPEPTPPAPITTVVNAPDESVSDQTRDMTLGELRTRLELAETEAATSRAQREEHAQWRNNMTADLAAMRMELSERSTTPDPSVADEVIEVPPDPAPPKVAAAEKPQRAKIGSRLFRRPGNGRES